MAVTPARTAVLVGFAAATVIALVAGDAVPAQAVFAPAVRAVPRACVQTNGRVSAIAISGGVAYLGGQFTTVTDTAGVVHPRAHVVAVDSRSCALLDWQADTNGDVEAITVAAGVVYVGGAFTTVQGTARNRLASVTSAGTLTAFDPGLDATVYALTARSGTLYAGGVFRLAGGAARTRLASWTTSTGALTGWTPSAAGQVFSLATAGSRIYVGGGFTKINGRGSARHLAALDPTTGAIDTGFVPRANFPVDQVVADDRGVYAAGAGGGGHVGIWNRNGTLQQPIYFTDGDVQTVAVGATSLFAGGHFANYCKGGKVSGSPPTCLEPLPRRKILEVTLGSGAVTSWHPVLNSSQGVESSLVDPTTGRLWIGGDFTKIDQAPVAHLAVFADPERAVADSG